MQPDEEPSFDPTESGIVTPRPLNPSPERSEGLFEISADDDEPPPRNYR
jgi:hypothetical protein